MMINNKKIFLLKTISLLLLTIIPFSISDYSDEINPQKITSDLSFYEINTCSISLNEFIIKNPNVIYQDHYKIRFNNYSSIKCFGTITGIDQLNHVFYISIGTNTLINIFLQSTIWLLLISFVKPKKVNREFLQTFMASAAISLLIILILYSEQRFYSKTLFELDMMKNKSYAYIFLYILHVSYFSMQVVKSRSHKIVNYVPYVALIFGVFSGLNLYFFSIFLASTGIIKVYEERLLRKRFLGINFLVLFWSYNAIGQNFYLKPDKIRGLSSSVYNFLSVSSWSYFMILSLIGLYYFIKERNEALDLNQIKNNLFATSSTILILGYLSSSIPYVNFINYYIFGQTKYGTDNQNIFGVNYWGESEAWRGFFPSAESAGELFAISILLYFITNKTNLVPRMLDGFILFILLIGLYSSNNKAAVISLVFCIFLLLNKTYKFDSRVKLLSGSAILLFLLFFIRVENLKYSFNFTSSKMIAMSKSYSLETSVSSAVTYFSNIGEKNPIFEGVILALGFIAFLINRSELWGLFFSRFNASISEFLFGTGPFILADHYSDIVISNIRLSTGTPLGFLLPHSSLLLLFLFFGAVGVLLLIFYLLSALKKIRIISFDIYLVCIFIIINLLKSDSILYLPMLLIYSIFFIPNSMKKEKLLQFKD